MVKDNKPMDPIDIGLLSSIGIMFETNRIADLVEELFRRFSYFKGFNNKLSSDDKNGPEKRHRGKY